MEDKKTKGRQKIELKRIEDESARLITFSKRRSGIYKKASELAILTGANVAVIVFSPTGKPFSFGYPSVDTLAKRFLDQEEEQQDITDTILKANELIDTDKLREYHNELIDNVVTKMEKGKKLKEKMQGKEVDAWWNTPIEQLSKEELVQAEVVYKELFTILCTKMKEKINSGASTSSNLPTINLTQMPFPFGSNNINENDLPVFPPPPEYN